jgi:hypothetical protein
MNLNLNCMKDKKPDSPLTAEEEFEKALLRQSTQPTGFNPVDLIRHMTAKNEGLKPAQDIGNPAPSARSLAPEKPKAPEISTEEKIRRKYDESFNKLYEERPESDLLRDLAGFRNRIIWAELRGNQYMSLEGGHAVVGYMVVLPPRHTERHKLGNSPVRLTPDEINVLQINPMELSHPWAGIILTYGLALQYARAMGMEHRNSNRIEFLKAQALADFAELEAADHSSGGIFKHLLDGVTKKHNLTDYRTFNDFMLNSKTSGRELVMLEKALSVGPPLNSVEKGARKGFLTTAIGLAVAAETAVRNGTDNLSEAAAFIEKMLVSQGYYAGNIPKR